ncbi:hypothetical protein Nepgr_016768 [Nepenthes gracilis]|uniref:Uncharacterized protein n=1 Tax=Nepenthes gracilis TaxID=150966 RepID=A0AAD3SR51_NEPGR|nr:hypothetical protein Nepgr_016768 [Nepenthes gracilis]
MAASTPLAGMQPRARSISLPTRLPSNSLEIEEQLNELRITWETLPATTEGLALGAETLCAGLAGLAELYARVDELVHSTSTRQALLHRDGGKPVEEAIDLSVGLFDTCSTARDLTLLLKDHARDLQSAIRRRGRYSDFEENVSDYVNFRKKATKDITKRLRALKQIENKHGFAPQLDIHPHAATMVRVLRAVNAIVITIFRHLLLFRSVPVLKEKASGWSLISKPVSGGSATPNRGQSSVFNEVGGVDIALHSLHNRRCQSVGDKQEVKLLQRRLQTLDHSIRSLEGGLDCLFRRIVQNRVSLLNVFTQ